MPVITNTYTIKLSGLTTISILVSTLLFGITEGMEEAKEEAYHQHQ